MIAVFSRVLSAEVKVDSSIISSISKGLLVYLGVEKGDTEENADKMIYKILNERIFEDENEKMNYSLTDTKSDVMIISNFTIASSTSHGLRPDFGSAEKPDPANSLYKYVSEKVKLSGLNVAMGEFGADMKITSVADGPVSLIIKS